MDYIKTFRVAPGARVQIKDFDPEFVDEREDKPSALQRIKTLRKRMADLQYLLYAERKHSLLVCLQGLDASGKDGTVRRLFTAINPQGCRVISFKEPTPVELGHNFLWRIEQETPARGEIVVFNRSHYEDVLVVRVHGLVSEDVWSKRYTQINNFEERITSNNTHILKFFLHISKDEQLNRFEKRLENLHKQWKISDADYLERGYWDNYAAAYSDMLSKTSTDDAPWFVIPSNRKWFRDLAIANILVQTMENLNLEYPKPTVDLDDIRRRYHEAVREWEREQTG